jgi:Ca-activated chloride channel family protein
MVATAIAIAFMLAGTAAFAERVLLDVSISNPYLLADSRSRTFLKIGLTGFRLQSERERTPANVAIVLDRSGSMEGEKIERAKEAAILALDMLDDRDIVSVVTYSDTVSVLVPATRVSEKAGLRRMIRSIYADGYTALFAGVSKGADEVSKFFETNKVNRVILLSDGLANVGPDSPAALGNLGASLGRAGISVTTIGLGTGYNEDLMVALAQKSDGNHAFVENSRDLVRIFEFEFKDVLSVVAQDVEIEINCAEGIRPLRVVGREADIYGRRVLASINQLYSEQEKYLILEVEVLPHPNGTSFRAADVSVQYANMVSRRKDVLSGWATLQFTRSNDTVEKNIHKPTAEAAVLQVATERSEEAVELRDKGMVKEAKELMDENAAYLRSNAAALDSTALDDYSAKVEEDSKGLESEEEWNITRKRMRDQQFENKAQQSY